MIGDRVVIDYVMWAYDAEQDDNKGREVGSRDGYTFFLGANQVNPAFDEGLVGMRVGGFAPARHSRRLRERGRGRVHLGAAQRAARRGGPDGGSAGRGLVG